MGTPPGPPSPRPARLDWRCFKAVHIKCWLARRSVPGTPGLSTTSEEGIVLPRRVVGVRWCDAAKCARIGALCRGPPPPSPLGTIRNALLFGQG